MNFTSDFASCSDEKNLTPLKLSGSFVQAFSWPLASPVMIHALNTAVQTVQLISMLLVLPSSCPIAPPRPSWPSHDVARETSLRCCSFRPGYQSRSDTA